MTIEPNLPIHCNGQWSTCLVSVLGGICLVNQIGFMGPEGWIWVGKKVI